MDPGFLILKVKSDGDGAEFTFFGVGAVAFIVVSAGAGAHKLEFRTAEHVVYSVLGIVQIVVMITFLGFVGESNRYLSRECVLVDGWNWPQIKVKDDGFFLSIAKSFFYLSLGRFLWVGRLRPGGRQGGRFEIRGFFFVPVG